MKIKRLLGVILIAALVLSISSISVFATGYGRDYGIVNTDGTRLRTTPNTSITSNILGQLYINDRIDVYGYDTGSGYTWVYGQVVSGGDTGNWGYVATTCLDLYQQ